MPLDRLVSLYEGGEGESIDLKEDVGDALGALGLPV